jgi:ribose transport system substrate-binding protein
LRGKWILDLVVGACGSTPKCKFALITGLLADPYSQAVIQAVKDGLKEHPTLELAAVREGLYLADPSLKVSQDVLQANPDLSVIATTSDPMTLGAEQAVKGAGLTGKVKLIGGGASSASVPAITSGRWYGTFLSLPTNEGTLGAELAVQAARGAKLNVGESAVQKSGLPAEITKDNVDQLTSKAFEAQW